MLNQDIMRLRLLLTLVTLCVLTLPGCHPEDWGAVYDKDDFDYTSGSENQNEPTINISYKSQNSYTIDGLNFSYCIENVILEVGDTLKITVDSNNEVKPWVKLNINDENVLYTSELPADYSVILDQAGGYELMFQVYDQYQEYQFTVKTGVAVD